uniref:Uncharacterized protein n=1 Tax=Nelumbo nucifera TaxID=4432 RepID=A0A822Y9R0_NELNU|nr:TPA_asm: hypothetical protein HUJ06_009665 [Nelumbo nucifera]
MDGHNNSTITLELEVGGKKRDVYYSRLLLLA